MSIDSRTVVALKSSFLRTQSKILSQPLKPPDDWYDGIGNVGTLPESVVKDVMREVNRRVKQHTKTVYNALSIREVAEQIDQLYWNSAAPDVDQLDQTAENAQDSFLRVGDDLSLERNIAKLSSNWDRPSSLDSDHGPLGGDAKESYTAAVIRLHDLSARRLTFEQKVSAYRTLLTLLKPYRAPQESIQPNLITRDALIVADLTKVRTLAIRVAGRVEERFDGRPEIDKPGGNQNAPDVVMDTRDGNRKLGGVLSTW